MENPCIHYTQLKATNSNKLATEFAAPVISDGQERQDTRGHLWRMGMGTVVDRHLNGHKGTDIGTF